MRNKKSPRKKYIQINGAKFKIELIKGTPPKSLTIATNRGLSLLTKGPKAANYAYKNKDVTNVDWSDWHYNINNRKNS